jgi:hypothetical protein
MPEKFAKPLLTRSNSGIILEASLKKEVVQKE